jgi:hypothetical protein
MFEVLKRNKSFLPLFREIDVTADELKFIEALQSRKFIKKDIILRTRDTGLANELVPILRYAAPVKALNYLEKQSGEGIMKDKLIQWLDYLRFAEFLGYDMTSSFVLFPRLLEREHDRVSDEYGRLAGLEFDEKIAFMSAKVDDMFAYENDKYLMRAPRHGMEIKAEGAALRHCVGGYSDRMAKLKTFILFLRYKANAAKPFYTVEFKDNEVRQCRGYKNVSATPEVEEFLDEWKSQLHTNRNANAAAA